MRISDWSSDVCSSALGVTGHDDARRIDAVVGGTGVEVRVCGAVLPDDLGDGHLRAEGVVLHGDHEHASGQAPRDKIGRASCRERGCQYVSISVVAGSLQKKTKKT